MKKFLCSIFSFFKCKKTKTECKPHHACIKPAGKIVEPKLEIVEEKPIPIIENLPITIDSQEVELEIFQEPVKAVELKISEEAVKAPESCCEIEFSTSSNSSEIKIDDEVNKLVEDVKLIIEEKPKKLAKGKSKKSKLKAKKVSKKLPSKKKKKKS